MPSGVYERQRGPAHHAWKGHEITTYSAAHKRAERVLASNPCSLADDTCHGRLESALMRDVPRDYIRFGKANEGRSAGMPFSVRPDDYFRLCRSHHVRYDNAR